MTTKYLRRIVLLTAALSTLCSIYATAAPPQREQIYIESIEELIHYATRDNVEVTMKSGVYDIEDVAMNQNITIKLYSGIGTENLTSKDYLVSTILHFSGNNSRYNLEGVTVMLSGELRKVNKTSTGFDLFVSGNDNVIRGLDIKDRDNVATSGNDAVMAHVMGDNNTLDGVSILVRGSNPYGYGHLLGKGKPTGLVALHKRSSLLISGRNTKLLNCRVITQAYGHGIFMQGAVNTYIEGCYVEGRMRTTDKMLAEKEGVAFDTGFKTIYPPGFIEPNRMMALSEDGIRTYPTGGFVGRRTEGLTVINSTVKNMRSGIDASVHIPPTVVKGCTTIGCQEKGYSIGSTGVIIDSRGDAMYGPLLTFQRNDVENCYIELELMGEQSDYKVTRLAEINGRGHYIKLKNSDVNARESQLPIVFGESFWSDVHTFRFPDNDPAEFSGAYDVTLINESGQPTIFTSLSADNKLFTNGEVIENCGENNSVEPLSNRVTILNRGVAGNTSSNLLARLDTDVVGNNPDLTIIMVGTNDMLNSRKVISYEKYEQNLTKIIERVKGCGSQVMLLSSIPADSLYLFDRHDKSKFAASPDEVMNRVKEIVQELSLRHDCYFVDLHGEFVSRGLPRHNEDIYIRNKRNSGIEDGVHPTVAGYKLIGEIVYNYFEQNNLKGKFSRIICFGDSITKGSGASGAGGVDGENYPSYLNKKLNE